MASATNPEGRGYAMAKPRPGLITFAACMMYLLAAFQIVFAFFEFARAAWIAVNVAGTFGGPLWVWGIADVVLAVLVCYAATDLLRGGSFGRIVGLVLAGLSALRWFWYLPAEPFIAIVVIAVNIIIIYGLVSNTEYFRTA